MSMSPNGQLYNEAIDDAIAGRIDDAITKLKSVIEASPNEINPRSQLGNLCFQNGRWEETLKANAFHIATMPRDVIVHLQCALAHDNLGHDQQALAHFNACIDIDPHFGAARWYRGMHLLKRGDQDPAYWYQGLQDYEWRLMGNPAVTSGVGVPVKTCAIRSIQPVWDGTPIPGKVLYITQEQGIGDSIMFSRFVQAAKAQSEAYVIVEVHPLLIRLYNNHLDGADEIVQMQTADSFARRFDEWIPMASLMRLFGDDLQDVRPAGRYIQADKPDTSWVPDQAIPGPKIGVCWHGNSAFIGNEGRSMTYEQFKPILDHIAGNGEIASLMTDQGNEQDAYLSRPLSGDFLDTTRRIQSCDLIITTDTSIPHLAGAMNKPVLLLLAKDADWRWFLNRKDSPFYPSITIFRQKTQGNWFAVVEEVKDWLKHRHLVGAATSSMFKTNIVNEGIGSA